MKFALDKGKSVTNSFVGELSRKRRLDKKQTFGLQNLLVRFKTVDDKGLRVGKVDKADEVCLWPFP